MSLPEILGDLCDPAVYAAMDLRWSATTGCGRRGRSPGAIYLQGGTEHTHGLSSSLISNIAVRCGEIVESIAAKASSVPIEQHCDVGIRSVG